MSTRAQVVKRKRTMDTGGPVAKWAKHKKRITRSGPEASAIAALNTSHDEEREKWRAALDKAVKQRNAITIKAKDEQHDDCATKLRDEDAVKIRDLSAEKLTLTAKITELSTTNTQLSEDVATEQAATRRFKASNYCLTINNDALTTKVALLQGTNDGLAEMYEDMEKQGKQSGGDITSLRQQNADLREDVEQWDEQLVEVTRQRDVGVERERAASLTFKQTVANQHGEIVAAKVLAENVKARVLADRAFDVETIVALRARVEGLEWEAENVRFIQSEFQANGQPPMF
jgi:chromosome segregation ATPase